MWKEVREQVCGCSAAPLTFRCQRYDFLTLSDECALYLSQYVYFSECGVLEKYTHRGEEMKIKNEAKKAGSSSVKDKKNRSETKELR